MQYTRHAKLGFLALITALVLNSQHVSDAASRVGSQPQASYLFDDSALAVSIKGDLSAAEINALLQKKMKGSPESLTRSLAIHLVKLCKKENFKPSFILSLVHHESTFRHDIVSGAGAIGLMQLLPATADYIARKNKIEFSSKKLDLSNPFTNLTLGVHYLSYLRVRYKTSTHFLAAYNMGPARYGKLTTTERAQLVQVKKYVVGIQENASKLRGEGRKLASEQRQSRLMMAAL